VVRLVPFRVCLPPLVSVYLPYMSFYVLPFTDPQSKIFFSPLPFFADEAIGGLCANSPSGRRSHYSEDLDEVETESSYNSREEEGDSYGLEQYKDAVFGHNQWSHNVVFFA